MVLFASLDAGASNLWGSFSQASGTATSGVVTGFLATSADPDATAADPTLEATIVYTGSGGQWLVKYDAAALTPELLAEHFAAATPYTIIEQPGGFRVVVEMEYDPIRYATIV